MSVLFRDRALKPSEKYQHYCSECGVDLHPDFAYPHKCDPIILGLSKGNINVGFVLKPKRERDFADLESYKIGWHDCMEYYKVKKK